MSVYWVEYQIREFFGEIEVYKHYFQSSIKEQERLFREIEKQYTKISKVFDDESNDGSIPWEEANKKILGTDSLLVSSHINFIVGGHCIILFHSFERFSEEIFRYGYIKELPSILNEKISTELRRKIKKIIEKDKLETFYDF